MRQEREFNKRPDRRPKTDVFEGMEDVDDEFRDRYYSLNAAHRIFEDVNHQKFQHRHRFDDEEKGGFRKSNDKKYPDKKPGDRKFKGGKGGGHKPPFHSDKKRYKR